MRSTLPTVGVPVQLSDIRAAAARSVTGARTVQRFRDALRAKLGARHCFLLSSGRAALVVALRALASLRPGRDEVVIPGYTCYSVPSAVARAGFGIVPCDVDPHTLALDTDHLKRIVSDRTLCLAPTHLFGLPVPLDRVAAIAARHGAFVLEDAAQAFGARLSGRPVGTLGDVGLYSLGRGKALSANEGGVLVTDSEPIAHAINRIGVDAPPPWHGPAALARVVAQAFLFSPSRFWLAERLPFARIGVSEFSTRFPIHRLPAFQAALGIAALARFGLVHGVRQRNADALARALEGQDGIELPRPAAGSDPAFLRLPLLLKGPAERTRSYDALRHLGASSMYPEPVSSILGARPHLVVRQPCPQADDIARRILTLPTHPLVTAHDREEIIRHFRNGVGP